MFPGIKNINTLKPEKSTAMLNFNSENQNEFKCHIYN